MRHSDRVANDIHEGGIVQSGPYRFSTLLSIIIIIFQHQISHLWYELEFAIFFAAHLRGQFLSMWHIATIATIFAMFYDPYNFSTLVSHSNTRLPAFCGDLVMDLPIYTFRAPQRNHFYPTT